MEPIANRNGSIFDSCYDRFTRRGVAFRGMAVNTGNIPGHPGSVARTLQARPRLPNRSRDVPRASASFLPPWAAAAAFRIRSRRAPGQRDARGAGAAPRPTHRVASAEKARLHARGDVARAAWKGFAPYRRRPHAAGDLRRTDPL